MGKARPATNRRLGDGLRGASARDTMRASGVAKASWPCTFFSLARSASYCARLESAIDRSAFSLIDAVPSLRKRDCTWFRLPASEAAFASATATSLASRSTPRCTSMAMRSRLAARCDVTSIMRGCCGR